ncbi:MAG: endonuclease/exonuclease/phosphatase family protein [Gammaproteobacteria bacterium]|nr:endonuclease/exonuclease/phosphatase family protein [Gammaproteobacteria bacterium]
MQTIRVISWNIRAGGGKRVEGILSQLLKWQADIIGLCEFRGTPASQWLAVQLEEAGYLHQMSSVNPVLPAKNALLLASRKPLKRMRLKRMPTLAERWILARVQEPPGIAIGLMHAPNYTRPELKYPFLEAVVETVRHWRSGPGLIMGDTNCGKPGIDEEKPFFGPFQREQAFMESMETHRWMDNFRVLHGDKREYTWYSHRQNGFRLDHSFCNPMLLPGIKSFSHAWGIDPSTPDRRESLSDHAALILEFDPDRMESRRGL